VCCYVTLHPSTSKALEQTGFYGIWISLQVRPRELGVFDASSVVYDDDDIRMDCLIVVTCTVLGVFSVMNDQFH
jgi:hypothetical protein